jgi:hypothetical protein
LPDCIVAYQKYQFGYILEVLGMDNVGIGITEQMPALVATLTHRYFLFKSEYPEPLG